MNSWIECVGASTCRDEACVLVTIAAVRGSAPRGPGAKMIVTADAIRDTIGGGNLEWTVIERARSMLESRGAPQTQLVRYPLGPGLRQCCGGVATLLFERITPRDAAWVGCLAELERSASACMVVTGAEGACSGRKLIVSEARCEGTLGDSRSDGEAHALAHAYLVGALAYPGPELHAIGLPGAGNLVLVECVRPCDFRVVLFGAGHIGRALVDVLAGVDCRVTWIDPRPEQFLRDLPRNVRVIATAAPEAEVERAPSGAFFLVITHSHALDLELCERVLKRADFRYLGLIGSLPKRNRFLKCLQLEGVPEATLARLTCPIGVSGITGKEPAAIAIAVAAELLQVRDAVAWPDWKHSPEVSADERGREQASSGARVE